MDGQQQDAVVRWARTDWYFAPVGHTVYNRPVLYGAQSDNKG